MNYSIECGYSTLKEAENGSKPREKLERLGIGALTDRELLMLIIGSGSSSYCSGSAFSSYGYEMLNMDRNFSAISAEYIQISFRCKH